MSLCFPQKYRFTGFFLLLTVFGSHLTANAQTFRMPCEVTGILHVGAATTQLKTEHIDVEILSMGRNLYFKVIGDGFYQLQTSTLTTEEFEGKNLSSTTQIGAHKRNKRSGLETEVRVERETVRLHAYNDFFQDDRRARVEFDGKCVLPK
jgi:hypothetical protein